MSSLYRCRVRVAYKPYDDNRLIVFEDNQIADAEVVLKWDHSSTLSNTETITSAPAFYSSLSKSTCRVTINDPYLSGIAWPLIYDAASLYVTNSENTAKSIMLPACLDGQDPIKDRCRKGRYPEIDPSTPYSVQPSGYDTYPHLLVSMWYDVKGTKFGTDFYFRVVNMNVNHGSGQFPSVQIMGEEARSIVFNQNLANYGFPAGTKLEDAIGKIIKDYGYTPSFCAADYSKYKLVQPTHIRDSGLTPAEVIKRRLNAVGGDFVSMPTRDWADKVSICTRNEVNQGCKVFYLGVGLYEGYTMDGVPNTLFNSNLEGRYNPAGDINNFSIYKKPFIQADEYIFNSDTLKAVRQAALRNLKRDAFPGQFQPIDGRQDKSQATSGVIFKVVGPGQTPVETIVKIESVSNVNLFGISPNKPNSISYFEGLVRAADPVSGRIVILTKYFLYACGKVEGSSTQKCFSRPIYQEVTNLSDIKVQLKPGEKNLVTMGQVLGTPAKDKDYYVRFYISGPDSRGITVPPEIVYKFATPEEKLSEEQIRQFIGEQVRVNTPGSIPTETGLGPKANIEVVRPTQNTNAPKILIMAGHADFVSSGAVTDSGKKEVDANKRALSWVRENAERYGLKGVFEFYEPPSGNIPKGDGPGGQFAKTAEARLQGRQVIELHHDASDSTGRSGVIFPYSGSIFPVDSALSNTYGSFGRRWRIDKDGGLGVPKRGGSILEIAPFTETNARRALSPDKATSDEYFRQALEPFMKIIRSQYSSNPTASTPRPGQVPPTTSGDKLQVGLVGSTGSSSGPHLHVEFSCNKTRCPRPSPPITAADVSQYIEIQGFSDLSGIVFSPYNAPRSSGPHQGIDFAAGGIEGKPVFIKNGAKIVKAFTGCTAQNVRNDGCGSGFGNHVVIDLPNGKQMLLAHFLPGSVSPERINGQTAGSRSGSNRAGANMSTGPSSEGLHITTSFKGIPRALRIIPGRTILSFITDYEKWLEEDKPRNRDPGVWIPERFSKYFIKECTLSWRGDLRVTLRGVIDWGYTQIQTPPFSSYVEQQVKSGAIKVSDGGNGYFNYIRSLGDLCYKVGGKDSCETVCKEVQEIEKFLRANQQAEQTRPDVTTNYAPGPCRYNGSALTSDQKVIANGVMDAMYSAGIRGPIAMAGILGNALTESTMNPGIHLTSGKGRGCTEAYRNLPAGHPAYGLFQWCYERQDRISTKCGRITESKSSNLQCQLQYTLQELQDPFYGKVIARINAATTATEAAKIWNEDFEKGKSSTRGANAELLRPGIRCN